MHLDSTTSPADVPASDAPLAPAADPFDGAPAPLRAALAARGYDEATAVQRAVLDADACGRDLSISSQTGSGKTVALGLALAGSLATEDAAAGPLALILVPTRELAQQVRQELAWLFAGLDGVRVESVTGGSPLHLDRRALAHRPRVLVGTPGRTLDHVRSGQLDLSAVREMVLDEADQMLDMGFREDLEAILDATPTTRRTHLVSATFPEGIRELAARYQREPLGLEGTRLGESNANIAHEGHLLHAHDRYAALVNLLLLADGERVLVFVPQRSEAAELAEKLEGDGFAALPLSGELAQSQRVRTLAAFKNGSARVLVATDVAARGLDVPDVALVVHTAPPIDALVYTHRSGRTGRAGARGRSVLFSPPSRRRRVERLLREADVRMRWLPVPTAAEVRATLAERERARVDAELDAALAAGPSEAHLARAEELLADRDAAPLVAALLARLEPANQAAPRDVRALDPRDERRDDRRGGARDDRRGGAGRPYGQGRPHGQGRPGGRRRPDGDMVRFFVNWGSNQDANPSRLLAAICRRGQVSGASIGSIAIHPNASTFDVRADVAERFERLAGRRDPRDPHTHIRRDRGPRQGGGPGRRTRAGAS